MTRKGGRVAWLAAVVSGLCIPAHAQVSLLAETSLRANDRPVRLEVILSKPPTPGPHPLAVVNHGSTGRGNDPTLFDQTWAPAALAAYFLEKGFAVAFPQRRGRGRSDGLYDEGFDPARRFYSCDPERSLPGLARAVSDVEAAVEALARDRDLDTSRLLLVGQSRGGVVAVAYAGRHPDRVIGLVNFVGGWMGQGCPQALAINTTALGQGARFPKPSLWLYATDDSYYAPAHTRQLHESFNAAGGQAQYELLKGGHGVSASRGLWEARIDRYLAEIGAIPRP